MELYLLIITEEIEDKTGDYNSKRNIQLEFISDELRNRYLSGYLQPFLHEFKSVEDRGWVDERGTYNIYYSFKNEEIEIDIITDIPLANERAKSFDKNRLNKYVKDERPIEERRELAIKNPLLFHNENSTPYTFNLSFKGLDVY